MSVHDKVKIKWWYWPWLILGSAMVVGGVAGIIVL